MLILGHFYSIPASIPDSTYVFRNAFRESLPCTSVNAFMKGLLSLQYLFIVIRLSLFDRVRVHGKIVIMSLLSNSYN